MGFYHPGPSNYKIKIHNKPQVNCLKMKERHVSEDKKTVTIKVSAELKGLLDKERKLTGETITQIIERAVSNLQNSDQRKSPYNANQELHANQLRKIANDLRQIVSKVDKIAAEQVPDKSEALNFVVVSKKHPWHNHPQKEKIYKLVRAMHRVGANLSMIAYGLNLEGFKNSTADGEWKTTDVQKIVEEIRQERDYIPPIYSLPDEQ
jgi:hypothetical protein